MIFLRARASGPLVVRAGRPRSQDKFGFQGGRLRGRRRKDGDDQQPAD